MKFRPLFVKHRANRIWTDRRIDAHTHATPISAADRQMDGRIDAHTHATPSSAAGRQTDGRIDARTHTTPISAARINKKAQLSLTNPLDACKKFARFTM